MTKQVLASKNPDIVASVKALRRAARRALEIGLSPGTPVYVMKDGKIVDLTQEVSAHSPRIAPLAVRETGSSYRTTKPGRRK